MFLLKNKPEFYNNSRLNDTATDASHTIKKHTAKEND